jgi:hypothetical protein
MSAFLVRFLFNLVLAGVAIRIGVRLLVVVGDSYALWRWKRRAWPRRIK